MDHKTIEHQRPGRWLAVIVRDSTRDRGFVFARLLTSGEECFVHRSVLRPPELWEALTTGAAVTCYVSETSKGLRGHDVRAAPEAQAQATAYEESHGNR